jgi:radical SAM superfamily enzyme YgiQ (UPF0313 family)
VAEILLATINAKYVHPSLALRLLRANLGELEERSAIIEFALRQPLSEKIETILAARPRLLAVSVSIWNHEQTLELLRALAERWKSPAAPRPIVVLGGPEASNLPPEAPLLSPPVLTAADYLVRGEGEAAFSELCRAFLSGRRPPARAAALTPSRGGGPTILEAAPVDPARIDPGYRLYTAEDLACKLVYVEASRGCPFGCEFCLSSLDRSVREFPLDGFLRQMDGLIARGAKAFKFLDRTFNLDAGRAGTIMDFFLARLAAEHGRYVHFEMVPARFPLSLREKLVRFPPGSLRLEVGIQTFNAEVAARIGRASDPGKELEALRFLRAETNATVHADLIAGLPGETAESFARGFDLLWETRPGEIQLGILKRLPGAPISRHDAEFRMEWSPAPPYEILSNSAMSRQELDRVKTFARFWELIVNRGRFDAELDRLLPQGVPAFERFSALSDRLFSRFGRSWAIPLDELRADVEAFIR